MVPVVPAANPPDDPADAAALRAHGAALADAAIAALPQWIERQVATRFEQWAGRPPPDDVCDHARRAGIDAAADIEPPLRALLAADVDAQRTNPLAILRRAAGHATAVLHAAGVPPVERDPHAEALFPDDAYDLSPAAFADLDPSVHEPGLVWGAAKAHVILGRRRH